MIKETNRIDTLLTGGTIITMNPERQVLHDAALAVHEGKILWIGDASEAESRFTAGGRVDLQGRVVIPGLVNTIIALFKDTSLVIIIGLFDLFSSVQQATVDPVWLGMSTEGYVFAALIYWIFCFSMSRYSQHLEKRFNTGRTPH